MAEVPLPTIEPIDPRLPEVLRVRLARREGPLGWFVETWRDSWPLPATFVQSNHVLVRRRGTVRGLHFQAPPKGQCKLMRVVRGSAFFVAVDLRRGDTFGLCAWLMLRSPDEALFVPADFAHGYCTLEPETEVHYEVSKYWSPPHERGVLWSDPRLEIPWPIPTDEVRLSEGDRAWPLLADLLPLRA